MVGITGFEPAASSSRTKRATKLRYIPMALSIVFFTMNIIPHILLFGKENFKFFIFKWFHRKTHCLFLMKLRKTDRVAVNPAGFILISDRIVAITALYAPKACSKSAMISFALSVPMERRMVFGLIP